MECCDKKATCTAVFKKVATFNTTLFQRLLHVSHMDITNARILRFDWLKISPLLPSVHLMNCFRNEFAFDSNFVMTQLRSSNFPDSSQVCSCSTFMQEKLEFIRQNLQFIDLNHKMETFNLLEIDT